MYPPSGNIEAIPGVEYELLYRSPHRVRILLEFFSAVWVVEGLFVQIPTFFSSNLDYENIGKPGTDHV